MDRDEDIAATAVHAKLRVMHSITLRTHRTGNEGLEALDAIAMAAIPDPILLTYARAVFAADIAMIVIHKTTASLIE